MTLPVLHHIPFDAPCSNSDKKRNETYYELEEQLICELTNTRLVKNIVCEGVAI